MVSDKVRGAGDSIDTFPRSIILTRWFLTASEMGIATYFVLGARFELGIMFLAYGVVSVFLLLPLIRCVRCYYYGKRCNFGWGRWVARLFPRAETGSYASTYGYTLAFWPLRIIPFVLGLMGLIMGIRAGIFKFAPHGLFVIYIAILFIHRRFYRSKSCMRCHQREGCPVYDARAILSASEASPHDV